MMIKKIILPVLLMFFLTVTIDLKSQDSTILEKVTYINSELKENPFRDTFFEITYYYSIDITPDRELVVHMAFDGPFTTTFKASLMDLATPSEIDTATEWTSSICWHCKEGPSGNQVKCIYQENLYPEGNTEIIDSDDICIMLPAKSDLRKQLIEKIEELVKIVLE